MTAASSPATRDRAARRLVLRVWAVGLLASGGLGLAAALVRPEHFWLVFGVFTACCLAPCIGLAWLTVGAGRTAEIDPRAEENVETRWIEKAASGALFDVLMAIGLVLGVQAFVDVDLPADGALLGVWAFALTDGMLRYAFLRRREA
jgi:hypothetical protein